jgi:hypothetical protein
MRHLKLPRKGRPRDPGLPRQQKTRLRKEPAGESFDSPASSFARLAKLLAGKGGTGKEKQKIDIRCTESELKFISPRGCGGVTQLGDLSLLPLKQESSMASFFRYGRRWEIPVAAQLGCTAPGSPEAFTSFLFNLEPMLSEFIKAHPACPHDVDMPDVQAKIRQFMERRPPSNRQVERWRATFNPAHGVTFVSWFLITVCYLLDSMEWPTLTKLPHDGDTLVIHLWPNPTPVEASEHSSADATVTNASPRGAEQQEVYQNLHRPELRTAGSGPEANLSGNESSCKTPSQAPSRIQSN